MFVQRMVNDEAFRERVLAHNRAKQESKEGTSSEEWMRVVGESPTVEKAQKLRAELDRQHPRLAEIRLMAQALAFRSAEPGDAAVLVRLLNEAYAAERATPANPQGFNPDPLTDRATVDAMILDPDCRWLLVEAPDGQGEFPDGLLLGCCCFSVGGAASATTPDVVGAVRMIGVREQFKGLCLGQRLLARVETEMRAAGSQRSLACIPDRCPDMVAWAKRRGYAQIAVAQYPERLRATLTQPTQLVVCAKPLVREGPHAAAPTSASTTASASAGAPPPPPPAGAEPEQEQERPAADRPPETPYDQVD